MVIAFLQISCSKDDTPVAFEAAVTSAGNAIFTVGKSRSFTFTATGNPAPVISISGRLPVGLGFNNQSATVSGTPAGGSEGIYPLTIEAYNNYGSPAVDNFILIVSSTVLIVHDGTGGKEADIVSNLTSRINAAGLTVVTSVGPPAGNLMNYAQIWDVQYDDSTPLADSVFESYKLNLIYGGTLFLIGEKSSSNIRNGSIDLLLYSHFTDPSGPQTVSPAFRGPDSVTTVTFVDAGGLEVCDVPLTMDSLYRSTALYIRRGLMDYARAGQVIIVFDADFLTSSADANLKKLVDNMIALP